MLVVHLDLDRQEAGLVLQGLLTLRRKAAYYDGIHVHNDTVANIFQERRQNVQPCYFQYHSNPNQIRNFFVVVSSSLEIVEHV